MSPVDAVEALLGRIRRRNPALHAFIAVYEPEARLAAEAADKAIRSGHRVGPLHGVPIALKDLVDLQGRVTTGGSKVWAERVSPVTATLAERLIAAGMIVLGKTHTVEFAMGGWGTNTHMGTPRNPWDLSVHRTPGGSSSGSGVAVSAGLAPVAIGTDTGGSVRIPAAWCGIVGLKVTAGRISTYGVLPLSSTLDTPGPLARSVEDAALIYRVLSGADPRDPQTLAWAPVDPLPTLRRGVAGLRLAVLPDAERVGVEKEVLAAYDAAVNALGGLGAQIVRVDLPRRLADYTAATGGSSAPRAIASSGTWSMTPRCRQIRTCGRASSSGRKSRRATISWRWRSKRGAQARVRRRARRCRRGADADRADRRDSDRSRGPVDHVGPLHAAGQLPRTVRPRDPQRIFRRGPAALAPDPVPRRTGGDRAPHRLGVRAGHELEGSPAAGAVSSTKGPRA